MRPYVVSLLVCLLFSQLSCSKKDDVPTIYVPSYLQQMLPYTNGQVVRFENTNGSIVTAVVEKTSWISEISGCSGCMPLRREESIKFRFMVGDRRFFDFQVDNRPVIFLGIMSPAQNYQIGGGFDFDVTDGLVGVKCTGPRQACVGTITLNGKIFNDVLRIINGGALDQITKAYYNVSKGLVGFEYGNGLIYHVLD